MNQRHGILAGALLAACSTAVQNTSETFGDVGASAASDAGAATAFDTGPFQGTLEGGVTDGVTGGETWPPVPPTTGGSSTGEVPDACGAEVPEGPAIVHTVAGPIEGEALGEVLAFRGVRYAEPPVGELRWRPPVPRACVPALTPAKVFGPVCPQVEKDAQGQVVASETDEDCLTLNVWTPAADVQARPVLVFIHGGGNAVGAGSDELFDGAALAKARDVVVVTLNYRLGALGFLTHPALAAESPEGVSGNYGILDQVLALEWVRDNIARFGGDPARVMVFGESAGAVNTCSLIGSPRAAGLFHGAIAQSGACRERTLAAFEQDIAAPWFTGSGCDAAPDPAACLRGLDVAAILATQPDGYPNVAGLSQGWGPHVDGVVLPKASLSAMSEGTHNQVPVIFGANAGETANAVGPLTVPQYEALVTATFGPLAGEVLAMYPAAEYGDDGRLAYVALTSDVKFVCNARRSARAADQGQGAAVFRYHFAYDGYTALPNTPKAAFHGLELIYIFGNWGAVLDGNFEYQPNADDLAMAARIQAAWVGFAATGDPAGPGLEWPAYVGASDNAALLDEPPGLVEGVRAKQCDFWDGLMP